MIKNNELRRGNRVFHNREIVEVESLNDEGINLQTPVYDDYDASPEYYYHNLDPIPLSPEVLEACGFENVSDKKGDKDEITGEIITEDWIRYIIGAKYTEEGAYTCDLELELYDDGHFYADQVFVKMDSLHQLQNLYYSLTGSELQVNLTAKV